MEAEGIVSRRQGRKDARQMIVGLTKKGRWLQQALADVPETVGSSVLCESVTPETVPGLFGMLDDIIARLLEKRA
jgi:DNA-binding MarR family transcriptional regulator